MWPLGLIVLHGLCMAVILQFFCSSISCSFLLLNSRPCLCWLQENASELQVEEWKKDTVYSRGIHKKCLSPKWKKAGDLWPVIFGLSFSSRFLSLQTNTCTNETTVWRIVLLQLTDISPGGMSKALPGPRDRYDYQTLKFWTCKLMWRHGPLNFWRLRCKTFSQKTIEIFSTMAGLKGKFYINVPIWPVTKMGKSWPSHGHLQNGPRWRNDKICNRRPPEMSAWMRLDRFLWLRIDHFFEWPTCLWILGPVPFAGTKYERSR